MSYQREAPPQVEAHSRAVLCRGYIVSPSSEELADALFAWTRAVDGGAGDMSLQFIAHGEDLASEWAARPFVVGVFLREVFGIGNDQTHGLTRDELKKRVSEADKRLDDLDASLMSLLEALGATRSDRRLWLTWSGPLCGAKLVIGSLRDDPDAPRWYNAGEGQPGLYPACADASQDEAAGGGAFDFLMAQGIYDNSDDPIELTLSLLTQHDDAIAEHGLDSRIFVLNKYD